MPVNTELAQYSDYAAALTFAVYVLALILAIIDFATGTVRKPAGTAQARAHAVSRISEQRTPGRVITERPPSLGQRFGKSSLAVLGVGAALNITTIVLRGAATSRWPLGNLYEYAVFLCAAVTVCWLLAVRRFPIRTLTCFVLLPVVVLFFIAAAFMYNDAAPLVPALKSYWIAIHVTVIVSASGILLFASTISLLHIIAMRGGTSTLRPVRWLIDRLPPIELLDRVAYRTTIIGFPLFTVGVICGAIWAEAAWGRFWGWDPKETVSFISWVLYAAYLHARATGGWKNVNASWINIAALVTMLFNMFIINFVVSGLHSYAGL